MSCAVLIREAGDDLPVGRNFFLIDADVPRDRISHHAQGQSFGCPATPTAEELNQIVADVLPDSMRRAWPIVINDTIAVPEECRGGVAIYQDAVGARPWTLFLIAGGGYI